MKSAGRYWVMIAVLVGAMAGMAHLSHGEATPPAKPLAEFPTKSRDSQKVRRLATGQRNRGFAWSDRLPESRICFEAEGLMTLYIGYFRSQRTGATIHSPKNCLPGAGWTPMTETIYQTSAGRWT